MIMAEGVIPMVKTHDTGTDCYLWIAAGVLFLLVFAAYSNTFESTWHLDDYPNVVNNKNLHLKELTRESLVKTFYSRERSFSEIYRPVACLTFAFNWYLGQNNVVGYHLVNISFHFITAFFLFLTIFNLYRSPNLVRGNCQHRYGIALLAAALWALNPIQTQAVTYIVQRMAIMAAMFCIIAIYFYVNCRLNKKTWHQGLYIAGCAVSYVLAIGSKENAVVLPVALFLIEAVFFQNLNSPRVKKILTVTAITIGFLMVVVFAYCIINANELVFLKGYRHRSFSLGQRLMTQPGIIVFYLSQLLYPMPNRLSIEHDFVLASSPFEPWTNIPAFLLLMIILGFAFFQVRKRPVLAFALLFFFVNQLIESSLLPLEMVFEHRNYLPSLFLFFPVSAGLFWLVDCYGEKNRFLQRLLAVSMILFVAGAGISTFTRNRAWATEKSLWEDAIRKAPGRARPAYNLAKHYAGIGQLDAAEQLYRRALVLAASRPDYSRMMSFNGLASIYFGKQDYETAAGLCLKALEIDSGFENARYNLVLALAKLGRWDRVSEQLDLLLVRRENSKIYTFFKGEVLLKQKKPQAALGYFHKALKAGRQDKKTMLNAGIALHLMDRNSQAEWFLRQAKSKSPRDIRPYIYLIDIGMRTDNSAKTDMYLKELIGAVRVKTLAVKTRTCFEDYYLSQFSRELICSAVNERIFRLSDKLDRTGEL
jgi:tetratricopeptide (TPR) repeat protein/multisubunit Na+/H+ antiporter MnhC subunit